MEGVSVMFKGIGRVLRGAAEFLASLSDAGNGRYCVVLQPYRGYGSREEAVLMGRVFKRLRFREGSDQPLEQHVARNLAGLLLRWSVCKAVLVVRFGKTKVRVITDRYGYFRVRMHLPEPPASDRLWHHVDIELLRPLHAVTTGEFFVPPAGARFVVISDIDDTVVETGVASRIVTLQRLLFQTAEKRLAFPGVASLYRALHRGLSGREFNPMLYVSQGPWGIYEMLERFFRLHRIPVGPILFLREWGLTLQHPLPHRVKNHKLNLIRGMLSLYHDLPFILIGDSAQHDPEIYTRVVEEHPGRVLAVYIRRVTRAPQRRAAIEVLARRVIAAGSSLVLAADSLIMAEHAVEHGLISSRALSEVLRERTQQQGGPDLKPTQEVKRESRAETW